MRNLVVLAILLVLLTTLLMSGISDTKASIANVSIPDNETANLDSANAAITITMYALPEEKRNLVTD